MKNLKQIQIDNDIRISLLKHQGNLVDVAKECEVPFVYVEKVYNKMRKHWDRDVADYLSSKIASHLFLSYQQRLTYLKQGLDRLDEIQYTKLSSCCYAPLYYISIDNKADSICSKCKKECSFVLTENKFVSKLLVEIVDKMRLEDETLVKAIEKLGFVKAKDDDKQKSINIKNNVLVMNNEDQDKVIKKLESLSPWQREQIRQQIESRVIEMSSDDKEIENEE